MFGGTWVQLKDRFLLGAGDTYENGDTGGESEHTLIATELPNHNHHINSMKRDTTGYTLGSAGSKLVYLNTGAVTPTDGIGSQDSDASNYGKAHNNMPPYLVVYMWVRTA